MKNKNIPFIVLFLLVGSCGFLSLKEVSNNCGKPPYKELILKTDHCSYSKVWITQGITKRLIYVCECDPGYECNIRVP